MTDSTANLQNSRIACLGFGAQGRAEAENLRRSGLELTIGARVASSSWQAAQDAGFRVVPTEQAIEGADTLLMNLPDHLQAELYRSSIAGRAHIKRLVFAHGFNTHFGFIPVEAATHLLIAPKGAAAGLRTLYGTPQALPAILGIRTQPHTSETVVAQEKKWAEAFAIAVGCHRQSIVWADFRDETVCDLFSEQALLCGGVSELLKQSFEVMTEGGYNAETAYFESLFELKLIVDLIWNEGIQGMRKRISPTARFGDLTRGPRVIDASVKDRMKQVLAEIESGRFAKEFLSEIRSTEYAALERKDDSHPMEVIGRELRAKRNVKPD